MKIYSVSADAYFSGIESYLCSLGPAAVRMAYDSPASRVRCEQPMKGLISAFALSGKRILSIAPNFGHEEFWFYDAGCHLEMIDLDEKGLIGPYLETLPAGLMTYRVGDVRDVQTLDADVVYISGFTVDELYKAALVQKARGRVNHFLFRVGYKLRGPKEIYAPLLSSCSGIFAPSPYPPWSGEPFHPVMDRIFSKMRGGSLLLVQSYAGTVVPSNKYIGAVRTQLTRSGLSLEAVFALRVQKHVHLIVARKASAFPAPALHLLAGRQSASNPHQGVDRLFPI